jgi:hypothetical protein
MVVGRGFCLPIKGLELVNREIISPYFLILNASVAATVADLGKDSSI